MLALIKALYFKSRFEKLLMDNNSIFSLGELFEDVQMQHVFPDGKTFVDCIPLSSLASIRQRYEKEKDKNGFDLFHICT